MIRSVLCIDDSPADQYIHAHRIRGHDETIDLRQVSDGEAALGVLREGFAPDVIFLDINMPGMGGPDFVEAYECEYPAEQRSPIFVMSSSSDPKDAAWAESKASILGHLVKPLKKDWFEQICAALET